MEFSVVEKTTKTDQRLDQAHAWLQGLGVEIQSDFLDVAGDASFRRYFRFQADGVSRVLMDAPPPGENVDPFIDVAKRLRAAGLHAPEIVQADRQNGYLLLEDLGDDLYRGILDDSSVDLLFPDLFRILKTMALDVDSRDLHAFSVGMMRFEMDLFPNWYLNHHRNCMSREVFDRHWDEFCDVIIDSALTQPQCFAHRDFHSCNLLKINASETGIIDFQDAVIGPVSYDLISLIWDRYIRWPRANIENWIEQFRVELGLDIEPGLWLRYCDLMGLQRNFKIVGIFARLHYRDGKKGYLEMIPRFYAYITDTLKRYPEFKQMLNILEQTECEP
jgi:aminoglycoside/choline kinase family phosphotransferase